MHRLTTVWGEKLDDGNVLPEYPRPQMKRDNYTVLNGYWDFTVSENGTDLPAVYDLRILVPFCPESTLSGIGRVTHPEEFLWYRRSFDVRKGFVSSGRRLLLHFGAVDLIARVYINGRLAGSHKGGYYPFEFDITRVVREGENELIVAVSDPTDRGYSARGKQKLEPGGMFYTPVSGIWQTVWTEEVPEQYISSVKITPMFDEERVRFEIQPGEFPTEEGPGSAAWPFSKLIIRDRGQIINEVAPVKKGLVIEADMEDFTPWSPENPSLYDYELTFGEDCVTGYFAMRKISTGVDKDGIPRLFLNNAPYFHNGLLDQGYWPDGLYTAPTDEALEYDIRECRKLGFNMLRKHAKIEPLRWYYHCDRLGMLVWQDIVNGGGPLDSMYVTYRPTILPFTQSRTDDGSSNRHLKRSEEESRACYRRELKDTIEFLYNSPCIVMWVLFNEGWGQFDSRDIYREAAGLDPTRIFDHASGWFDRGVSDVKSLHIYFTSFKLKPDKRPVVISEFGGYSLPTEGHVYTDKVYGYRKYTDRKAFCEGYRRLYETRIIPQLKTGLCAAVYTQVSDIEEEINGLLTYDRKVLKIDSDIVHRINIQLCYSEQ